MDGFRSIAFRRKSKARARVQPAERTTGIDFITPSCRLEFQRFPDSWKELPRKDSNLDKESQNLLCYHYTTRQFEGR